MNDTKAWRGVAVKVLTSNARTAIIITPCAIKLQVRAAELSDVKARKTKLDSRKF